MKKLLSSAVLLCLFVLSGLPAWAQVDLVVSVFDNARQPVVGVPVQLDNAAIGFSTAQPTNAQGQARFRGLSTAGHYAVSTAVSAQYQAVRETGLTLRANSSPSVTLVLPQLSRQALNEVTVSASSATTINTRNA